MIAERFKTLNDQMWQSLRTADALLDESYAAPIENGEADLTIQRAQYWLGRAVFFQTQIAMEARYPMPAPNPSTEPATPA